MSAIIAKVYSLRIIDLMLGSAATEINVCLVEIRRIVNVYLNSIMVQDLVWSLLTLEKCEDSSSLTDILYQIEIVVLAAKGVNACND
jgi:uncharacterized membrane protein